MTRKIGFVVVVVVRSKHKQIYTKRKYFCDANPIIYRRKLKMEKKDWDKKSGVGASIIGTDPVFI